MPKFMVAPPGTNPMEMPELIKRKRRTLTQTLLLIGGLLILLTCVCGVPAFFLMRPKVEAVAAPTNTFVPYVVETSNNTLTPTTTLTPYPTQNPATPTRSKTATPMIIERVITKVVVNRIFVDKPIYKEVEVTQIQLQTVVITQIITATSGPTQTPWIIVVTATETPTPTPTVTLDIPDLEVTETPTPTETPTETPTATEYIDPYPYPYPEP